MSTSAEAAMAPEGPKGPTPGAPLGKDPKGAKRDDKVTRMGTESIPKLILEFAIPSIVGMVVNGAYNLIDSVFLGQAVGEIGIATMTVAGPVMIIFMALAMLIGVGGNAYAALLLGQGKKDDAELTLGNTLFLAFVLSGFAILFALNPTLIDALVTFSGSTEEVRPYAVAFIRIICFGFIFQCIGMGINNFIRTAGAPNVALGTMVIGTVFCILFNYLFVMRFGWGVEGSALATISGQAVSCAAVMWYFTMVKNVPLRLRVQNIKPQLRIVTKVLTLGLASFFVQVGAAVLSFVTNHLLIYYGALHPIGAENALAAIGVNQRIAMFSFLPVIGVATAIQPLIGFNYGARKLDRVKKTLWYGIAAGGAIGLFMWAAAHIWPTQIVGIFGITQPGLMEFTVRALQIQLFLIPLISFQMVGANYFQATGQPMKSVFLTLTRQVLFSLPLFILLPQLMPQIFPGMTGLEGIFYVYPVSDFLSIFTTALFITLEMKRLKKLEKGEIEDKIFSSGPTGKPGPGMGSPEKSTT